MSRRPLTPEDAARLARFLADVAAEARVGLLLALAEGPRSTAELAAELGRAEATLAPQLARLRASGLVELLRGGRRYDYELTAAGRKLASALATLGGDRTLEPPRTGDPS